MLFAYGSVPSDNHPLSVRSSKSLGLTVVVPILNELGALPKLLKNLQALNPEQTIIVDGGSSDGGCHWLEENWKSEHNILIRNTAGRAAQMNAGAALATEDMLLFLHADTRLPAEAKKEICSPKTHVNAHADIHWGRFDLQFSPTSQTSSASDSIMAVIAFFINLRSRTTHVSTGDQALFIHRILFSAVGHFEDIPLMEDVAICKRLRKILWPHSSTLKVTTSPRRWEHKGILKTVLTMWWFRLAYFCGQAPETLKKHYDDIR